MAKIKSAEVNCGNMVDIFLDNGNIIMLNTDLFVYEGDLAPKLMIDGNSVYWPDGPRLSLGEAFDLLMRGDENA